MSTVSHKDMVKYFNNILKITIYVKLRSFQYRSLTQSIVTNVHLKRYKIKLNEECSFCGKELEMLKHLFYDCEYVTHLWTWFCNTLSVKRIDLSWAKVAFLQVQYILTRKLSVIRWPCRSKIIYVQQCNSNIPTVSTFINCISQIKQIEFEIARSKNKQQIHDIKWSECQFIVP